MPVNGSSLVEPTGIEPATYWLQTQGHPDASEDSKGLTSTPPAACTSACTSEAETDNAGNLDADPLTKLAAALLTLSPADRARLAAMLARG